MVGRCACFVLALTLLPGRPDSYRIGIPRSIPSSTLLTLLDSPSDGPKRTAASTSASIPRVARTGTSMRGRARITLPSAEQPTYWASSLPHAGSALGLARTEQADRWGASTRDDDPSRPSLAGQDLHPGPADQNARRLPGHPRGHREVPRPGAQVCPARILRRGLP